MGKMIKSLSFLLLYFALICGLSKAESIGFLPQPIDNFNLTLIQNVGSCSYTVVITTSCSSPRYTRDQISIAFGDAYGNQIYAPRLDDPSSRAFESCSMDTYDVKGPCAYQICYIYLYRSGPDGWKPGSVKIYGYNSKAVTFDYNVFIPSDTWYGFNLCQSTSSGNLLRSRGWFVYLILGVVAVAIL